MQILRVVPAGDFDGADIGFRHEREPERCRLGRNLGGIFAGHKIVVQQRAVFGAWRERAVRMCPLLTPVSR